MSENNATAMVVRIRTEWTAAQPVLLASSNIASRDVYHVGHLVDRLHLELLAGFDEAFDVAVALGKAVTEFAALTTDAAASESLNAIAETCLQFQEMRLEQQTLSVRGSDA